ncbi:hypothetical protein [Phytomonospora endophytica]|uniref:Uncharacterized protein n=1 Tax=Phytomonospora endophytica TaxID=714109 RepID=A0A841FM07_9ACTN|nr:hypothetical protein [Phytomonospora endophytica]MBB6032980.1 hypothetical protein [Phytomonospora endophytica]GIG65206.1 hypothetical protein Pen01_15010 [Phytomonospora endophytica]
MPLTFDTAKAGKPAEFKEHSGDINTAHTTMITLRQNYLTTVSGLEPSWKGRDYAGLQARSKIVGENIEDAERRLKDATTTLGEHGPLMEGLRMQMVRTENQARLQLYLTQGGRAQISPIQMARLNAMAATPPPAGQAAYAAELARLELGVATYTGQLQYELLELIFQDLSCAARMHSLGLLLKRVTAVLGGDTSRRPTNVTVAADPAQRPGGFRAQTMRDSVRNTPQNPPGTLRDAHDGSVIGHVDSTGMPRRNPANPFDVGHPTGHESIRHEEAARLWGRRRADVNARHNSVPYRLESRPTNRSGVNEGPMTTNLWVRDYLGHYDYPPMPTIP